MEVFEGLLAGERLFLIIVLFLLFSAISLYSLSMGQPRSLLKGLWMTLVDLFVAPFAYLRYAVFRLATEGGQSVRLNATDPQFLLRTAIRIQLAVLLFSLSLVGSFGLMLVLDQSVPPEVSDKRNLAAARLRHLRSESLPAVRRELEEVQSKINGSRTVEEELRRKRGQIQEISSKIDSSAAALFEMDSGGHFGNIHRFLNSNARRLRTSDGRGQIRDAVSSYLKQSPTGPDFDEAVSRHLDLVFQRAALEEEISGIESANRPEALQMAKRNAEERLNQLLREERELEKETSLWKWISDVSLERVQVGLFILLAVAWAVLWFGGISIESAEIFIDIATNLRKLRRLSEGRPEGTVIVPADQGPAL
ncbi:MAG: hypothetical protein N2036_05305 [Bryobacteraceae bacterium]|nr:hypothetical protein [Bryobacteraceae bacterium]MCX7603477.1 hypothetical protein [Bryobacteraceae bacterium]